MTSHSRRHSFRQAGRNHGLWGTLLLAAACVAPAISAASTGLGAPQSQSGRAPVKNIIELRSDTAGDQYFMVFVRADPILPQKKYRQDGRAEDRWKGTVLSRGTATLAENILWPIEVEYEKPDGFSAGGKHPYIELDAIPASQGYIKTVAADKFTPDAQVSQAFQDHQKDWDFMVGRMQEILSKAGVHLIDQESGVRQEFFLSSLKNVKAVKACLLISAKNPSGRITAWDNLPKDGGDWYYRINGHKVSVKEMGGWNATENYNRTGRAGFELTLKPEWLLTSDK